MTTSCEKYSCQREEQCDDCWMIDHLKECDGCDEFDHPPKPEEAPQPVDVLSWIIGLSFAFILLVFLVASWK